MTREDLDAALAALDRALRDRPEIVYDDLNEAVRHLVRLRDLLIADGRGGVAVGDRLDRLNAILSIVVATEYPLEGVRRDRVARARQKLAALRS